MLLNQKGLGLWPQFSKLFKKIPENYCFCLHLSIGQVWRVNELKFKRYIQKYTVSRTNTHHDVTDLVSHGLVKNTKI